MNVINHPWKMQGQYPNNKYILKSSKNTVFPADVIKNWLRARFTIEYLGLWEQLNNPDSKLVDFDQFRIEARSSSFVLSPQRWILFKTDSRIKHRFQTIKAHTKII